MTHSPGDVKTPVLNSGHHPLHFLHMSGICSKLFRAAGIWNWINLDNNIYIYLTVFENQQTSLGGPTL